MVSTHGATCALIGQDGALAAPILDYEQEFPAEVNAEFARVAPPFSETYSPDLPGGLNFARTIFFQEWADPTLAKRARHILSYPQYWCWRLCGALASEVSFLGCHSQMWNPRAGRFSSLAVEPRLGREIPAVCARRRAGGRARRARRPQRRPRQQRRLLLLQEPRLLSFHADLQRHLDDHLQS